VDEGAGDLRREEEVVELHRPADRDGNAGNVSPDAAGRSGMSMSDVDKDGYDRSTEADRIRAQFERGLTRLYPVQYTSEAARTTENGEEVERMKSRVVEDDLVTIALRKLKSWSCPEHHSFILEPDGTRRCKFADCSWTLPAVQPARVVDADAEEARIRRLKDSTSRPDEAFLLRLLDEARGRRS
jgi:hypothetical protein